MSWAVIFLILLLITPLPYTSAQNDENIKIVKVYIYSDPGCEYVVLENWGNDASLHGWTLTNGRGTVHLPNIVLAAGERLVLAEEKQGYRDVWQREPDYTWDEDGLPRTGLFRLVDKGDDVILMKGEMVMDTFCYGDGEEGMEGWDGPRFEGMSRSYYAKRRSQDTNSVEDWTWLRRWRLGQSNFTIDPIDVTGNATMFVSPDNSFNAMMDFLDSVEYNLVVGVYILSDPFMANKITNMSSQGIDIKVLVEGSPVGGISLQGRSILDIIHDAGVEVKMLHAGHFSPYSYFHCKYMIADNSSVLVSSENFGSMGYPREGNYGNRGWGIVIENHVLAGFFTDMYLWDSYYSNDYIPSGDTSYSWGYDVNPTYRPLYDSLDIKGNFTVIPVLSPDSSMSEDTILGMINDAEENILVQQLYAYEWGDLENPYLGSLVQAAERGVDVKIQLDSTWYNLGGDKTDNDYTVDRLNNISSRRDIPLKAALLDSYTGLDKVHNKGMIVDNRKVLISSINWNSNSVLQNREVGLIVESDIIGEYFAKIFMHDWQSDAVRPIADAGRDREVRVGSLVGFDGSYSWDNKGIASFRWDLTGDGIYETEGGIVSKVFRQPGVYIIGLRVEDEAGNVDTDTAVITVTEPSSTGIGLHDSTGGISWFIVVLVTVPICLCLVFAYKRYKH